MAGAISWTLAVTAPDGNATPFVSRSIVPGPYEDGSGTLVVPGWSASTNTSNAPSPNARTTASCCGCADGRTASWKLVVSLAKAQRSATAATMLEPGAAADAFATQGRTVSVRPYPWAPNTPTWSVRIRIGSGPFAKSHVHRR